MKLKSEQAKIVNENLNVPNLKVKHVSGENYLKILKVKKQIRSILSGISESQKQIIDDLELLPDENSWTTEQKRDVYAKTLPLLKDISIEIETNFIPIEEFKEWTKEQDTGVTSFLAEYFLKDF